jgi:ribosomal protein S18 acetylase RimI-like enzyme
VADTVRETVYAELRSFNRAANPELRAKCDDPANDAVPLSVIAYDAEGAVAGGLFGETQFSWFKLSIMAIRADLRGQGFGRELVARAEAEARRRGCRYVFLDTMSYQAPGFYERLGYRVTGRIEDWDSHGHAKYFFTKTL